MYGHDAGGTRYSPLKQINTANVSRLQRAWTYHTGEKGRSLESTPIFVHDTLYLSTQNQNVVALDPVTGREIWKYTNPNPRGSESRGVAHWPAIRKQPPRILFGTGNGQLIALDAKTGTLVWPLGDKGVVDLRAGIADGYPKANYAISSPPVIYRDVVMVGPSTQESGSIGPSGEPRELQCAHRENNYGRFIPCRSRESRVMRPGVKTNGRTGPVRANGVSIRLIPGSASSFCR